MPRQPKPQPGPVERARLRADAAVREAYEGGLRVVSGYAWAKALLAEMKAVAPNVPEEDLVRVFARKTQLQADFILGQARFLEYNHTHPRRGTALPPRDLPHTGPSKVAA